MADDVTVVIHYTPTNVSYFRALLTHLLRH